MSTLSAEPKTVVTLNDKGQLTIPASFRKKLGLKPGDAVKVWSDVEGQTLSVTKTHSILDAIGMFPQSKKSYTVEEMKEAVQKAVAENVMNPEK